jgi:hypothetical protein
MHSPHVAEYDILRLTVEQGKGAMSKNRATLWERAGDAMRASGPRHGTPGQVAVPDLGRSLRETLN